MDVRQAREALRERRFRQRVSVTDLADRSGIDRSTLYRIENTKKFPDYEPEIGTLRKLAAVLGLTLGDLERATPTEAAPADPQLLQDAAWGRRLRLLPEKMRGAVQASIAAYEELVAHVRPQSDASDPPGHPRGERRASHAARR
jgi:transcriptional regulator with XRE-family HTH domain